MASRSDFVDTPSDVAQSPRVLDASAKHATVDLQGWLKKAPYGNLSMFGMLMLKKRYFVLCDDELAYYQSDEDFMLHTDPLGKIKICAFSTLTTVDGIDRWGVQLKIAGADNAVYLQAATRETRTLWVDKLRTVIAQNNRAADIIHAGYLVQRTVSGLQKQQKRNYFVVLADQITSLSKHYDDPAAVNLGSIFFTPGSTVRKVGASAFAFTGADDEHIDVTASSPRECEEWLSILIRTIEQFSQNLGGGGSSSGDGGGGGGEAVPHRSAETGDNNGGSPGGSAAGGARDGAGAAGNGSGHAAELVAAPGSPSSRFRSIVRRVSSRRHSFKVQSNEYRVWVGTWNMGNEDPFKGLEPEDLDDLLKDLVPKDHDIYVLGVQECVSSATFSAVEAYLRHVSLADADHGSGRNQTDPVLQIPLGVSGVDALAKGTDSLSALDLQLTAQAEASGDAEAGGSGAASVGAGGAGGGGGGFKNVKKSAKGRRSTVNSPMKAAARRGTVLKRNTSDDPEENFPDLFRQAKEAAENRPDRIYGRGDGAILFPKFTGMALFMRKSVFPHARVTSCGKCELTSGPLKSSKGATAFVLQLHNYATLGFVNCHLEANKPYLRREQFKTCVRGLGTALYPLARSNREAQDLDVRLELTGLFHHTMWMGDLNYRMVGLSGRQVQHLIKHDKTAEMHAKADGLVLDKLEFDLWHGFYEPPKAEEFFPTYKKHERPDPPIDFSQPDWPDHCYRTLYKEPQYKGGKWKERVPGWCDRILLRHMRPEDRETGGNQYSTVTAVMHYNSRPRRSTVSKESSGDEAGDALEAAALRDHAHNGGHGDHKAPPSTSWKSSYTSVNSGEAMVVSDHSPVRCSYNLSLHGFDETPAQKISLRLSNIMLVEEAGGSGFRECPLYVRLIFPAPFEELANEASVDVLKRQDARYTSTEARDGMRIECSYHHRKPLAMLHAVVVVKAKSGASGQCVFALDEMFTDPTSTAEAMYEAELHDRGVPLRMGWEEFCDPKPAKKGKGKKDSGTRVGSLFGRSSNAHKGPPEETASSDEEEALFADCAEDGRAAAAAAAEGDRGGGGSAGGSGTDGGTSSVEGGGGGGGSGSGGKNAEPPAMQPVVFKPVTPNAAVLKPRILLRFHCKLHINDPPPPKPPPAADKPVVGEGGAGS